MNGIRNNVVFCGFDDVEKNSFWLNDIRNIEWENGVYYDDVTEKLKHRFPYVIYVDTIENAIRHQGFAIFIKVDYSEIKNKTKREIDIYYRGLFHKFDCIYLYNAKFKESQLNNFSNITFVGEELLCGELDDFMNGEYFYFLKKKAMKKKSTLKVLEKVEKIRLFLKENKVMSSEEIIDYLNVSTRSIQRYMKILNDLYNCIGYDYYNNEWYYIRAKNKV